MTFDEFLQKSYITATDVVTLRREVFADGIIDRTELSRLIQLANSSPEGDQEWEDFFIEALTDFFLKEEKPEGYLTDEEFETIERAFRTPDGVINPLELRSLIALQKRAERTPPAMTDLILKALKARISAKTPVARIDHEDARLIQMAIYAVGGAGSSGITNVEAKFLFDVNDLTTGQDNCPTWEDLFKKAISAYLMLHWGYKPLTREAALDMHAWETDTSIKPGNFFRRMIQPSLRGSRATTYKQAMKNAIAERAIGQAIAEQITDTEARWLWERLNRDGQINETERALVQYLKHDLHADLPEHIADLVA